MNLSITYKRLSRRAWLLTTFGYSFPFFSSLLKKERKREWIAIILLNKLFSTAIVNNLSTLKLQEFPPLVSYLDFVKFNIFPSSFTIDKAVLKRSRVLIEKRKEVKIDNQRKQQLRKFLKFDDMRTKNYFAFWCPKLDINFNIRHTKFDFEKHFVLMQLI